MNRYYLVSHLLSVLSSIQGSIVYTIKTPVKMFLTESKGYLMKLSNGK